MSKTTSHVCISCRGRIGVIARLLNLTPLDHALLEQPQRVISVTLPVVMDDGHVQVFRGIRVQYNDALGPYKGGIRYHEEVSEEEVTELAFLMCIKNALANLPYGGGKGGVTVNPKELSKNEIERLTRTFTRALGTTIGPHTDVPAPDVNTDSETMEWIADEYGKIVGAYEPAVVTGKPLKKGGSRGRDTATGMGGAFVLDQYVKEMNWKPSETTVAIQGFGNVGGHIAHLLAESGYLVVAVSNSRGGVYRAEGFSTKELVRAQKSGALPQGEAKTNDEILLLPVRVLIPSALSDQITRKNARDIQAHLILEMANAPTSIGADMILEKRNIPVIPDILANAGGVIVSYFEWTQNLKKESWSEERVNKKLKEKMIEAYTIVSKRAKKEGVPMRTAAYLIAVERILTAEHKRGIL